MAEQKIKNDMNLMRGDIEKLDEALSNLEAQYRKTFDEIAGLSAMWEGSAHDRLVMQFEKDATQIEEMIEFLHRYKEELDDARKRYIDCESKVEELIKSI